MTIINHAQDFLKITSTWFNNETNSDLQIRLKKRVLKSSDKRLKNKDKVLHCHRLVLSSWSEVWAAALQDEKESCLDLLSHDAAIVEMCVKYCYTSTIDLTEENVTKVHLFAHQYNLKALETACEQMIVQLVKGLSATNCLGLYCYLLEHEFPNLPNAVQSIKEFVCREFAAVSKSNGFLQLPLELLCRLLKEDELNAHEDDILDACCRWLTASPVGSDPRVRERVLQLVRFPMLSAKKILEFKSHPLMSDSMTPRFLFALQWVVTQQIGASEQEALRIKLAEENKTEILTPRINPLMLQIKSQILDAAMTRTLSSMLGGKQRRVARLLVDSSLGPFSMGVFANAVRRQAPFICIIKSDKGHVFGAYVEDKFKSEGDFISGSQNNFLFSLKAIPPQGVVKLKRTSVGKGIHVGSCGLHMGSFSSATALIAFCSHSTASSPCFELAPGYESVGSTTLHGKFGPYIPHFMEVFALPLATS